MNKKRILWQVILFCLISAFCLCNCTSPRLWIAEWKNAMTDVQAIENRHGENTDPAVFSGRYQNVVIIGVDGAGAFFDKADTPNVDRIFENGATSSTVVTSLPTISAECWGSILLGVLPENHGLNNGIVESQPYDTQSDYPSVFRLLKEANPQAVMASFCNWSPINYGIVEDGLGVVKETADSDARVCQKICSYLDQNEPNLMFVQFDSVDGAGHGSGYGSSSYLSAIETVDGYIGDIYQKYVDMGYIEDTLFIVVSDHGGTPSGSHGGNTAAERYVFLGVAGKNVQDGEIGDAEARDVAVIVATALGLEIPKTWTGILPAGIFE